MEQERRIGVYVCYCGGNIGDYVDVEAVVKGVTDEPGVVVCRTHMFTCSDAAQQEIIDDIADQKLDGLVVASCSPQLHMYTFRGMAERAGLNPYQYVQVNLREQDSWAHTDNKEAATAKGINLVRSGIAKCGLTRPLNPLRVETKPRALVIGAGVSGMRAAINLADMGLSVYLIEKEKNVGGWALEVGRIAPEGELGTEVVEKLLKRIQQYDNIILYTETELTSKSGNIGDFMVKVLIQGKEEVELNVGAILVTTGFNPYTPKEGEYGWGSEGVVDLKEFRQMLVDGKLEYKGKNLQNIVFIYCVGSRQTKTESCTEPNSYCSRYCCTAATYTASSLHGLEKELDQTVNQYHLYRDIRTYGSFETVYEQARADGALFLRWEAENPPEVTSISEGLSVRVKDTLDGGEEMEIDTDLVVLVTGMIPRDNSTMDEIIKIPHSEDGFYKEAHIKLRPVETIIDGVFVAGSAQSPKTMAESVASSLAGVAKAGGLLKKGYVDLEPLIAIVDNDKCIWCDKCTDACIYGAIEKIICGDKEIAMVIGALCKGEGACVPVCPQNAMDIEGYRDDQIIAMIDAATRETVK